MRACIRTGRREHAILHGAQREAPCCLTLQWPASPPAAVGGSVPASLMLECTPGVSRRESVQVRTGARAHALQRDGAGSTESARPQRLPGRERGDLFDGSHARAALPRLAPRRALRRRHGPHAATLAQRRARYGEPPLCLERARGAAAIGRCCAFVELAELPELSLLQDLCARAPGSAASRGRGGGRRMGRVLAARTRRPTWDFVLRSAAPTPDMRARVRRAASPLSPSPRAAGRSLGPHMRS